MSKKAKSALRKAKNITRQRISENNAIIEIGKKSDLKISIDFVQSDQAFLERNNLPTIGYEFNSSQITIIELDIQGKKIKNPGKTGTISLDYIPPTGKISVSALATGAGTGTLQLTYKGKNVFNPPANFKFTHGSGFINETPKLP